LQSDNYLYTELKALLQKDEKIFDFIEGASLDGMWFWDLENPEHEWMSPGFWATLGYNPDTKRHLASEWRDIINQDDLEHASANFKAHCENPNHPYDQIVRYTHKSGKTVWVRCRGVAIRDAEGKPVRMLGAHTDVTALKEREIEQLEQERSQSLAFKKQAELLSKLERTANIGTWEADLQTNQVVWSEQTKRIHEVPEDFQPCIEEGISFYKEGRSRELIAQAVEQGISLGKSWDLELELVTYTGKNIWVRAHGNPIFTGEKCTGLFGVFQDITAQKEAEARIKIEREKALSSAIRLQLANDAIEMGVWEWDIKNNDLMWDEWMYRLYGVDKPSFSGALEAWENAVHPNDLSYARTLFFKAIASGEIYDTEFRIILPTGQIKHIKANGKVVFDGENNPVKVIGVNHDITDRIKALEVIEQEKLKAEAATQAKSDFLANMSHEIRTPMNAILGGLQLLKTAKLDNKQATILNNAAFSAQSLLTIINDILDYSKIESNTLSIEKVPFTLNEVLSSIKYDVDGLVSTKGIDFSIDVEDGFIDGWYGDIVRVKQILLNLVSNAVKFTEEGSVLVKVCYGTLNHTKAIRVDVIDSGIGMSEDAQARIFDRFSQADSSTTRKYGGTGLGMSITLCLIEMMKGDIKLKSTPGEGTRVSVWLPLERRAIESKEEISKSVTAPLMMGKKILIAEDNAINQVVIQTMLEPTKAALVTVDNGLQAVDAVKNEDFDLILMDIHMPEMDGMGAQKAIAALKPHVPVIALTANVMAEDVALYLQQGFSSHIPKPVDMNILYGLLQQYL
jgi:PAS domain S-box-containing protein